MGYFLNVIVYFFPFEVAEICLSYGLLDGDFHKINIWRFPFRFDAFGGFWMEISIKHLEISIEI